MDDFLAFVDSLELSDIDVESGSSDNNSPVQSTHVDQLLSPDQRNVFKRKKRKRPNLSSSTRLQQTKKAETLFLRRRALELEEQITQLKIAKCSLSASRVRRKENDDKPLEKSDSEWIEKAEAEYDARLKSEETNRMLKLLVAKQTRSSMSLQARLIKQTAANEMDLLQIDAQLPTASSPQAKTSNAKECKKTP